MDKQIILSKLDMAALYTELVPSLKVNGKTDALGLCPFHNDTNPSLSVNLQTGLFRCFACGAKGDAFTFYMQIKAVDFPTALKEMGETAGVAESNIKTKVVAKFEYKDKNNKTLYIKERLEPGRNGRSKEFVFKHSVNSKWTLGRGCDPVLYNLPGVIKSKNAYVVEGEAKAGLLNSWGLVATCLDSGANSPWKDAYIPYFEGKQVVIFPDKDEPGNAYALKIANALHGKVEELTVVELPGLQEKEDILDWAKTPGNDKEKLVELVKNTPQWTPKDNDKYNIKISTIGDMLRHESPEYLIRPFLYRNTVNLLQSLPGVGKSLVVLSVANAITNAQLLWGNFETQKGNVLIIDEENPGSIHRDRIEKMGISKDSPRSIHFVHYQGVKIDDPKWLEALIKFVNEGKYALVVFDALIRMHNAKENDSDAMSKVMWGFREIVRRGNTTVLIIHHERKSRDGEKRERSRGSGDIVGAIDSQLVLEEGAMTDDGKELILHPGKTRLKSFAPIRLVLNSDTLNISYVGNVLSGNKEIIQSVIQFLGDGIHDFEEIQQVLCIPEKQLRLTIKNALGKELILDSTLKQHPDYRGSPKKQFYKANPAPIFSHVAMFPHICVETCHIDENRPSGNKVHGNMDSLDSVGCGVVSEHSLPHETLTKKHVSEGAKKEDAGNMENCIETEEIFEVEFVEEVKANV